MERVFFDSDGTRLAGIISGPMKGPGAVLVHGFGRDKGSKTNLALESALNEKGITTLRLDVYGHGESAGSFEDVTCSLGARNVGDAINLLKGKGCTRIGLVGSSFGGYLSYLAASRTKDLMAVALKCPVADWKDFEVEGGNERWRKDGFTTYYGRRLRWAFYEDATKVPAKEVARDIHAPVLIVHGMADALVPISQSREMAELIPRCMLLAIDGADHRFSSEEHFNQMLDAITTFMVEHLR